MIRMMILILQTLAALGLICIAWLIATWYCADPGKVLGPPQHGRVTFKMVLQGAFRDLADLAAPVVRQAQAFWVWSGQTIGVAVISLDAYVVQTPELKAAILATPFGLAALLALNLATAFARVSQTRAA